MKLETFLSIYPLTRKQLATLCDCSEDLVVRWFLKTNQRKPTKHHEYLFDVADWLWSNQSPEKYPAQFDRIAKLKR